MLVTPLREADDRATHWCILYGVILSVLITMAHCASAPPYTAHGLSSLAQLCAHCASAQQMGADDIVCRIYGNNVFYEQIIYNCLVSAFYIMYFINNLGD